MVDCSVRAYGMLKQGRTPSYMARSAVFVIYWDSAVMLLNSVLKCLAGLKYWHRGFRNLDDRIGSGVAANSCAALFDLKGSKADQLHLFSGNNSGNNSVQGTVESGRGILLSDACTVGDLADYS